MYLLSIEVTEPASAAGHDVGPAPARAARPASPVPDPCLSRGLSRREGAAMLAGKHAGCNTFPMSVSVLDREMFTEAEAARLLRVPQRTLNYWLEGGEVRGRVYRPIIRTEPLGGHAAVTWAEFVEAGLLREYRQTHRIPMAELRAFINQVRAEFGVPYPLAHQRPFVSGKELLSVAQDATGLDPGPR